MVKHRWWLGRGGGLVALVAGAALSGCAQGHAVDLEREALSVDAGLDGAGGVPAARGADNPLAAFCGQGFDALLPPDTCLEPDAPLAAGDDPVDLLMTGLEALCGTELEAQLPAGTCDVMDVPADPAAALCGSPLAGLLPAGTCDAVAPAPAADPLAAFGDLAGVFGQPAGGQGGFGQDPTALCGTGLEALLPADTCDGTAAAPAASGDPLAALAELLGQGAWGQAPSAGGGQNLCGTAFEALLPAGTCDGNAAGEAPTNPFAGFGQGGFGQTTAGSDQAAALCGSPFAALLPAGTCDADNE